MYGRLFATWQRPGAVRETAKPIVAQSEPLLIAISGHSDGDFLRHIAPQCAMEFVPPAKMVPQFELFHVAQLSDEFHASAVSQLSDLRPLRFIGGRQLNDERGSQFQGDKECDEHYRCDAKDHHCHRRNPIENHLTKMESRAVLTSRSRSV